MNSENFDFKKTSTIYYIKTYILHTTLQQSNDPKRLTSVNVGTMF